MKKLEINENNWTGDKTIIKYDDAGNLEVHGNRFKIQEKERVEDLVLFDVLSKEHNWDSIFTGVSYNGIFVCEAYGVERTSKAENKHIAAAQLICNIM